MKTAGARRNLVSIADLAPAEIGEIFDLAARLKAELRAGKAHPLLAGRTLAMIFEKPSLRTRVTFEVGMAQLGGVAIHLAPGDIQLGRRESVADVGRNLGRWVDLIMARTFAHDTVVTLARAAGVPVINGLSDLLHPCQVLSDCFTLRERRRELAGMKVAFVGDGNNVAHSWMYAAARLGFDFVLACPAGYGPRREVLERAQAEARGRISVTHDVTEAARGADVLYTDVWTSMGQEQQAERRRREFAAYRLDTRLLALAAPDAVVMHCLPAHRGEEITGEVIDGPHSIVLDQAENRLHLQKGLLVWLGGRG